MWKYVLKRLLLLIPVMLGTILVVFFIMDQSDVDPAKVMLGDAATEETIAQLHEELGLDDPFLVRYARYVLNLIKGDMGTSYNYHTPVQIRLQQGCQIQYCLQAPLCCLL